MPICKKCNTRFPNKIKINDKIHSLNRRRFCLSCSPFGLHNTLDLTKKDRIWLNKEEVIEQTNNLFKICPKCKIEQSANCFYISKREKGILRLSGYCKSCVNKVIINRGQKFKRDCVKYKGEKCEDCGFNGYDGVFDFHHLDPSQKDFNISNFRALKVNDKVKKELDKCALLCANCHRIRHGKEKGLC